MNCCTGCSHSAFWQPWPVVLSLSSCVWLNKQSPCKAKVKMRKTPPISFVFLFNGLGQAGDAFPGPRLNLENAWHVLHVRGFPHLHSKLNPGRPNQPPAALQPVAWPDAVDCSLASCFGPEVKPYKNYVPQGYSRCPVIDVQPLRMTAYSYSDSIFVSSALKPHKIIKFIYLDSTHFGMKSDKPQDAKNPFVALARGLRWFSHLGSAAVLKVRHGVHRWPTEKKPKSMRKLVSSILQGIRVKENEGFKVFIFSGLSLQGGRLATQKCAVDP